MRAAIFSHGKFDGRRVFEATRGKEYGVRGYAQNEDCERGYEATRGNHLCLRGYHRASSTIRRIENELFDFHRLYTTPDGSEVNEAAAAIREDSSRQRTAST